MVDTESAKTILVVDDSEADVELITLAIHESRPGFRIEAATHGAAALDYLYRRGPFAARAPGVPSLVILDNKMPGMGGAEVAATIRQDATFGSLPIVMFSGSAHDADIERAYLSGVNSYVVKPTGPDEFTADVSTLVGYWTERNTI